jgi:hypothetical protein
MCRPSHQEGQSYIECAEAHTGRSKVRNTVSVILHNSVPRAHTATPNDGALAGAGETTASLLLWWVHKPVQELSPTAGVWQLVSMFATILYINPSATKHPAEALLLPTYMCPPTQPQHVAGTGSTAVKLAVLITHTAECPYSAALK